MSGSVRNTPELTKALRAVTEGDTFVVWKSDRIARSLKNLLEIVEDLTDRGVAFKSLTEEVYTGSPMGSFFISM
jgi:DNA invertase Pin-like site-specific DNA recombinase